MALPMGTAWYACDHPVNVFRRRTRFVALGIGVALWIALAVIRPAMIAEQGWQAFRARGVLRLGIDPSVRPFSFFGAKGWEGFEADVARHLVAKLGVQLEAIPVGFDGFYDAITAGYVDASMSMLSPDPLRTADFAYSRPYFDAGFRIYTTRASLRSVDDLRGWRLAVARGSEADRLARHFERRIPRLVRVPFESHAQALAASKTGLTDAALLPAELAVAAGCPPVSPAESANCFSPNPIPYVIAVPRSETRLLEAINHALDDLDQAGVLAETAKRWFRETITSD